MTAQLPIAPYLAANPRASLASLPVEIKAEIVGQARGQDERYHQRMDIARAVERFVSSDLASEKWYGKSTTALSMVNKEFRGLAEAHLFKTIRCRKVIDLDASLMVLPLFARNARVVTFDYESDTDAVELVLLLLASLPKIDELHIHGSGLGHLVDFRNSSKHRKDFVYLALRAVAPRISHLSLCLDQFQSWLTVTEIITSLSQVRVLEISGELAAGDRSLLRDTIAGLGHLEELSLQDSVGYYYMPLTICDESWSDVEWRSLGTLKALQLLMHDLNDAELKLVQLFSPSLEELHIETYSLPSTLPFKSSFPRLTNLKLQGYRKVITSLLPFFATSPLRQLELCHDPDEDPEDEDIDNTRICYDAAVSNLVQQRKSTLLFLTITICRQSETRVDFPVQDYHCSQIAQRCADLGVFLCRASDGSSGVFDDIYDPGRIAEDKLDVDPAEELRRTCDAAEQVFRFGIDLMARMRDTGDLKGAKQSLKMIRDLRARQQLGWL